MGLQKPEGLYLSIDGKGNAEIRVRFRRENIPYLTKAMAIIDDILAMDEEPCREPATTETNVSE